MSFTTATARATATSVRVLTLTLGSETYAINVMNVREIIRPPEISPVPRAAAEMLGVINLRGKIVPVIDLRIKFGLNFTGRTERTCIAVVQTGKRAGEQKLTGLMVDEVQEVLTINASDVEAMPDFGGPVDMSCISGLAKVNGSVMIMLDLERTLAAPTLERQT